MRTGKRAILTLCGALLTLLLATPVLALDLDQERASGRIGEQADGYVGAVGSNPPTDIVNFVMQVNQKRRAEYGRIAKTAGTDPKTVAARAGQRLMKKAPPGQYIKPQGKWVQK